ncbi:uncharacterized protein PHACADRAFT_211091 [Phanerochaete carnosa HHB-10118-sp]|uniref:Uncharacterized protein n=1 Tax=Phanerochaete carnosa (strain HHB-10118-sp) TaxID=650164 RepID=K5WSM2_PHACS|nr:uncharacterized protein PHACADRAFT_211091 [Phanerochaete carnosa HHB-10118-sp]EKM53392.1 hypothetical protein PHACADRAFT_211091 [Phanerochaete carnosa HHB-10118-sp]
MHRRRPNALWPQPIPDLQRVSLREEARNLAFNALCCLTIVVWLLIYLFQYLIAPWHDVSKRQIALYLLLICNSLSSNWNLAMLTFKLFTDAGYVPHQACPIFPDGSKPLHDLAITLLAGTYFVKRRAADWPSAVTSAYRRLRSQMPDTTELSEGRRIPRAN